MITYWDRQKCYIPQRNEWMTFSSHQNIYDFILSWSQKLLWCERDRRMEGDEDRLSYLPMTSSWPSFKHHLALHLLLGRDVLNQRHIVGRCPSGAPSHSLALSTTDQISSGRNVRQTQDSHCPVSYEHISVQTRDRFYLFSLQRIADWRLGQVSICNRS